MASEQLDIFEKTIKEQLLGPGSDILVNKDPAAEVISDTPLRRYFTGILFPVKITETQGELDNDQFESSDENNKIDDYIKNNDDDLKDQSAIENDETSNKEFKNTDDDDKANLLSNHFYPSDMGITFCVDSQIDQINVDFSFATYSIADQESVSVESTKNLYDTLMNQKSEFPFKSNTPAIPHIR